MIKDEEEIEDITVGVPMHENGAEDDVIQSLGINPAALLILEQQQPKPQQETPIPIFASSSRMLLTAASDQTSSVTLAGSIQMIVSKEQWQKQIKNTYNT